MKSFSQPVSAAMNQRGAIVIIIAISLVVLVGFVALAIDVSDLIVVRNQLQNAADAGALAGARFLYIDDGTGLRVNVEANQFAYEAAIANKAIAVTGAIAVDVNWEEGQNVPESPDEIVDVQRGHWSFGLVPEVLARGFYASDSTEPVDLWDVTTAELDSNINFINAVKVVARRQENPAPSFFARIFGYDDFQLAADAVAYIGFAANLQKEELDQPIGICRQSIVDANGNYTCGVGRMVTDSNERETAAWTNFEQPEPCTGAANAPSVAQYVCQSGNPDSISFGADMQVINGQVHSAFKPFWDCWWENSAGGTKPWGMTLAVITCSESGTVSPCEKVIGTVEINVIWVNDKANTAPEFMDQAPSDNENMRPGGAPLCMAGFGEGTGHYDSWPTPDMDISLMTGAQRWASFVEHFHLQLNTEDPIDGWNQKTIYFVPSCDYEEPKGDTGGENFGILAKIPKLVE